VDLLKEPMARADGSRPRKPGKPEVLHEVCIYIMAAVAVVVSLLAQRPRQARHPGNGRIERSLIPATDILAVTATPMFGSIY
jgi:hypothetical protein